MRNMSTWQYLLMRLVAHSLSEDRDPVFRADPPTGELENSRLPQDPDIRAFYSLCDGGVIGHFQWYGICQLEEKKVWWEAAAQLLSTNPPFEIREYVVLGETFGGDPIIWDAFSQRISFFYTDGGEWEITNKTSGEFLDDIFDPSPKEEYWYELVEALKREQRIL